MIVSKEEFNALYRRAVPEMTLVMIRSIQTKLLDNLKKHKVLQNVQHEGHEYAKAYNISYDCIVTEEFARNEVFPLHRRLLPYNSKYSDYRYIWLY